MEKPKWSQKKINLNIDRNTQFSDLVIPLYKKVLNLFICLFQQNYPPPQYQNLLNPCNRFFSKILTPQPSHPPPYPF